MSIQLPHDPDAAGRRPQSPGDGTVRGFVRRIAAALDFWSSPAGPPGRPQMAQVREWCEQAWRQRGRIAGLMAIANVADAYRRLDAHGKDAFFALLRDGFSVDEQELRAAIAAYAGTDGNDAEPAGGTAQDPVARSEAIVRLSRALESPRLVLFEQFNTIPSGIKFLVDLRADLVERLRDDPTLEPLEYELHRKLASFFNLGFLKLERIGWDSPAELLENLIRYEAVNHIGNWEDLKHRLVSDRACFAFLHPAMPYEPVIFVEVALVRGMAKSIQRLLDPTAPDLRPDHADTAIFYGISNAQRGLRRIQFGNLLIKQVVARLSTEVPNVKTYATLSPLPLFRTRLLDSALADGSLAKLYEKDEAKRLRETVAMDDTAAALRELLGRPDWHLDPAAGDALKPGLLRAARQHLAERTHHGHAACPVAHFHGSNGALLARLNWLADSSPHGIAQSAGIMANYLYDLERFEEHQSVYLRTGHIAQSKIVKGL
jgi:malonyl-CoA decarboxylase